MQINFLAILVCGVLSMIVGSLWYGKIMFGDMYMRAIGGDPNIPPEKMKEIQKKTWQLYLTQFLLTLFQVWVLAIYLQSAAESVSFMSNALWIWGGFVLTTNAGIWMWSAQPRKLAWQGFLISSGYQLVMFVVFAFILKAWM